MTKRLATILGAIVAAAILIFAIGSVQDKMSALRTEHELVDNTVLDSAPPTVAFVTVALGGFRGILADILFLRCQQLHEQESYFEHVQLADWLVKLQPKFTGATSYLAWNMAYNVSVTFTDARDRWRWVQRGIELVRDEALRYHTTDPKLYWQLGWIFQHKVGDILDDANWYYKSQYALQVMETIGFRHEDYDWNTLAAAPDTWRGLRESLGPDAEKLDALLRHHDVTLDRLEEKFRSDAGFPEAIGTALEPFPWKANLENTLRRRWLQDRLNLDPNIILEVIEKHGDLDFRLPEATAVYWATMGLKATKDGINIECERMIFQCMSDAFRRGRLVHITNDGMPFLSCNPSVGEFVRDAYLDAAANNPNNKSILSGYENFMKDAVVLLYANGYRSKADEFRKKLLEHPRFANSRHYKRSVDDMAIDLMAGDIAAMSTDQARSLIASLMNRSHILMATANDEEAATLRLIAKRIFDRFNTSIKNDTINKRKGIVEDMNWKSVNKVTMKMSITGFHPELRQALLNRLKSDGVDTEALLKEIEEEEQERLRNQKIQRR